MPLSARSEQIIPRNRKHACKQMEGGCCCNRETRHEGRKRDRRSGLLLGGLSGFSISPLASRYVGISLGYTDSFFGSKLQSESRDEGMTNDGGTRAAAAAVKREVRPLDSKVAPSFQLPSVLAVVPLLLLLLLLKLELLSHLLVHSR